MKRKALTQKKFSTRDLVAAGVKLYKGYSQNKKQRNNAVKKDYGGVTTQHDSKTLYNRKSMPGRKRKAWTSFKKKVNAVEISNRGKTSILLNTNYESGSIAVGAQAWSEAHLYSFNGIGVGNRDLAIIAEDINTYPTTVGATQVETFANYDALNIQKRVPILLASATLDLTWTNSGSSGIELDVYSVSYKRQATGLNSGLVASMALNASDTSPINVYNGAGAVVAAAAMQISNRGVTPFDVATGFARSGGTIMKKEKFFIAPGNSITKDYRDPRNLVWRPSENSAHYSVKGRTFSYLFCAKSVDPVIGFSFSQKSTRSYKYTIEGQTEPRSRYSQE